MHGYAVLRDIMSHLFSFLKKEYHELSLYLFGLSANQPAVFFSHTKSASGISQPVVIFSRNKSAPATSLNVGHRQVIISGARIKLINH